MGEDGDQTWRRKGGESWPLRLGKRSTRCRNLASLEGGGVAEAARTTQVARKATISSRTTPAGDLIRRSSVMARWFRAEIQKEEEKKKKTNKQTNKQTNKLKNRRRSGRRKEKKPGPP